MQERSLEKTILRTISYFNIFDFPLTGWEIWKNLWQPETNYSLNEVNFALDNLLNEKILGSNEGFYFLKRKDNIVFERKKKYLLAQAKIKKAKKYIQLLNRLPYVRAIFICNNLAYQNAREGSDIDLTIICARNKIWTARLFCVLAMKLLRQRPTVKSQKDKICLSFYITEDNLNLQSLAYENDVHFIYWLNQFVPVCGRPELINNFFQANIWTKKYLPNYFPVQTNARWQIKARPLTQKISEGALNCKLFFWAESLAKKFQLKVLPRHLRELAKQNNTNVVINDKVLKFHDKDTRLEILQKWNSTASIIINSDT